MKVRGCSHTVLGAIRDQDYTDLFQQMLRSQDVFRHHFRSGSAYLNALGTVGPTWTSGNPGMRDRNQSDGKFESQGAAQQYVDLSEVKWLV